MASGHKDNWPRQRTVSLPDTSGETGPSTSAAPSPELSCNVKKEPRKGEKPKKPPQKRKSWGQELPTPQTNLPPRKRAKTVDEKEQRRIERTLRNRRAAQSSRVRKRQEIKKLEGERRSLEWQNESLKQRLMVFEHEKFLLAQNLTEVTAQMEAIKTGSSTPDLSTPTLGPDFLEDDQVSKERFDEHNFSLLTPQNFLSLSTTHSEFLMPATIGPSIDAVVTPRNTIKNPAAMLWDLHCLSPRTSIQPTTFRDCDSDVIGEYTGSNLDFSSPCTASPLRSPLTLIDLEAVQNNDGLSD